MRGQAGSEEECGTRTLQSKPDQERETVTRLDRSRFSPAHRVMAERKIWLPARATKYSFLAQQNHPTQGSGDTSVNLGSAGIVAVTIPFSLIGLAEGPRRSVTCSEVRRAFSWREVLQNAEKRRVAG